jgi:alkaline phosphatase D
VSGGSSRRGFLKTSAGTALAIGGAAVLGRATRARTAPAFVPSDRPLAEQGLQIGDVQSGRAVVWSRSDRPARLFVEWDTTPRFGDARTVQGPDATPATGYTARVDLVDLPRDQEVFVRLRFEAQGASGRTSAPVLGRFRTAPARTDRVRLLWSADTAGQGWGINPAMGGMRIYETMLAREPDLFLHSGDTIYADGPMVPRVELPDGSIWENAFLDKVPSKLKVAETLDEFRGCYLYNLCDENLRAFNARVPQIWQWDDHEVLNNWSDGTDLRSDARYTEKRIRTLVAHGRRAFLEHAPMRWSASDEEQRIYRRVPCGSDLEIFVLDMRSYRSRNTSNREAALGPETVFLGRAQMEWLKDGLERSRATWKIVAADMPLGLEVRDGSDSEGRMRYDGAANGGGPALGRELELAELLSFLKHKKVRNVVWLTADVHYCAAHHYDPTRAQFQDFDPFWEFVAGPLNAGTFGPNPLDDTFGPRVMFQKVPPQGQLNLPPTAGLQFFGQVDVDPRSKEMVVSLHDIAGAELFRQKLVAEE